VDEPAPLNEHADASVRYYSGLVTYSNIVTMRAEDLNASSRIVLETSNIGDIAVVRVNESEAGYLWAPPYELDLKPYLQPGPNRVEVQVANYWANRMIGFSREGLSVPGFPEGVYESDAPLRVAGLVGPLRLARVQSAVP
jgi:hypothetical protein